MIQLKWSDEKEWKDVKPLDGRPVDEQLDECRKRWAESKEQWNLTFDCEFRVKP